MIPEKKARYDSMYMSVAETIADRMSHCERLKVGAIAVKDGRIISMGWNGQPSGFSNVCELDGATLPTVLHAESNLIAKLARSTESSEGCTIYVTHSPCMECAKLIHQAGVSNVVYKTQYRSADGVDFLRQCGIMVASIGETPF